VTTTGGSFEWSAQDFGKSVLFGAAGGALGAGAGFELFGAPTRAPLNTLWSLTASLNSLASEMGRPLSRTVAATAIGGTLFQNLVEGMIDEIAEQGIRRFLPLGTTVGPSTVPSNFAARGWIQSGVAWYADEAS